MLRSLSCFCGLLLVFFFSCNTAEEKKQTGDSTNILKRRVVDFSSVLKPVSSSVLSNVKVISPMQETLPLIVDATGYIDYDNYSKWDISSRYSGRIEKLYIRYNYQHVNKGEMLFEIYSPDLVTAQENFVYALQNSAGDTALINSAREKLILLQFTSDQIREIESSRVVKNSLPVYSKFDGYVREIPMETNSMASYQQSPLLSVREGMYADRGQILFNVVNQQKFVAMLKIKSDDLGKIKLKQEVTFYIDNDSSMQMNGTVDFIDPVFNSDSKTLNIRVNVNNNKNMHKIGSLVNAKINSGNADGLWLPKSAVIDLGSEKIVWILKDGSFRSAKVETGQYSGGMVEIRSGLTGADQVAAEAHFLSDSEDFIKTPGDEK
ncbi:MAG: efflux RND transporter periplasmic adaptor subunit [Bacteroidetes bacterium]|nr:efflux RND transporter periplasmic adaptor subunit [Bacteroidota bacterium]